MTKVVHFGKYYFPDTGGIESVTSSIAKGALKSGYQVTVVCFDGELKSDMNVIEGINVFRAPVWKTFASQPISWRYVELCLREARQADLVHLHSPNMLAALCGLMIGKKKKLLVHWHSDVIGKGFLRCIFKPLQVALLKRADIIVTTSHYYADASPILKTFRSKLSVVPIGVSDATQVVGIAPKLTEIPNELANAINGKRLILSVGRLVSYKGFDVLIEATKFLQDDVVVIIVGGGPLQASLRVMIDEKSESDRVYLAGRLSAAALHGLFNCASIFCLPSIVRSEAFGVVLLEAMAYGLPIVATNIPGSGVPWVNKHGVSGFNVPICDPFALGNACNQILNSSEVYDRLAKGARHRFLRMFTENISVSRMLAVYELVLVSGNERSKGQSS